MQHDCPDHTQCLHLVASAGRPTAASQEDWSRLNGDFRRFPLNVRKIGHIGATGDAILIPDVETQSEWIARPEWEFDGDGLMRRRDMSANDIPIHESERRYR